MATSKTSSKTSSTKLATNQEISRDLWVPDSEAKACFYCNSIFSTFRRKHHCRICGSVFCSKCCTKQQIEPALLSRVCIPCSKLSLNTCKTALRMNRQNESLKNQILMPKNGIGTHDFRGRKRYVLNKDELGYELDVGKLKLVEKTQKSRCKNPKSVNFDEFTTFMHAKLSEKCPAHLASEIVSVARDLKHNSYHIKTVQNHQNRQNSSKTNQNYKKPPKNPRKLTITTIQNAVVGSQASLTTPKTAVSGRALFVSSSIQPSSMQQPNSFFQGKTPNSGSNSTNLQQIHQENYRLQKCANKANIELVNSIIVLGTVCWAFRAAAEEHGLVIISCHSERQFRRLMKCLGCEKPISSIYGLLEDDFGYDHGFGEFEGFEYLKVFDKQLFCYKVKNIEFKSVVLICKDLIWLKWAKKLLVETVKAFVNWRGLQEIPWDMENDDHQDFQDHESPRDLNNNTTRIYSKEIDEYQVPHFCLNKSRLKPEKFTDFELSFEVSPDFTAKTLADREIREKYEINATNLKIFGLYNDVLETEYLTEPIESLKPTEQTNSKDTETNAGVRRKTRTYKKHSFGNKKLCKTDVLEMNLYAQPANGDGYYSLRKFLSDKERDVFRGCVVCKNKIMNHLEFFEHGEYRVEVGMRLTVKKEKNEKKTIETVEKSWEKVGEKIGYSVFIAFDSDGVEKDQLCLQEVGLELLTLPFCVFMDSMNFTEQIHFLTPTSITSLKKIPTNPKLINPQKSTSSQKSIFSKIPMSESVSSKSSSKSYSTNKNNFSIGFYLSKSIKTAADKYEETSATHRVIIKSYENDGFLEIREKYKINTQDFAKSVSTLQNFDVSGGKKCKEFYKSLDEKYILKKIENPEAKFFENNGSFVTDYLFTETETFLARLLGVWSVKIYEDEKKIEASTYILMENVFCGLDMIRKFDLKGSTRNRRALSNSIIWDSDYIEHEEIFRPLQTFDFCKEKMMSQLKKDVEFLKRYNIMDYSLIVGECEGELKIGVVDYLRSYTWDKALESIVKSYLPEDETSGDFENMVVVENKPTILPANEYKNRFLDAIEKYVHVVNFDWE